MDDIKEKIGSRITQMRKKIGITIKELATRTGKLSAARISNWEQGTRSPGPVEAKLLAKVLEASASYLLCLTDNPQGEFIFQKGNAIHFVEIYEAAELSPTDTLFNTTAEKSGLIGVDRLNKSQNSKALFAMLIDDASMEPDFKKGDLVIIDRELNPAPGDYVFAYLAALQKFVFRKYGENAAHTFQLLASNPLWANLEITANKEATIYGVIVEQRRYF